LDIISESVFQGMFKPAEAPQNMAPVDTTTTAVSLAPESAQGNNLTGLATFMSQLF
jgi:hypothetical protein